jgi:hypothetical protein
VSATYNIDDHMTHRVLIYEYPNPWVVTNWGISLSSLLTLRRSTGSSSTRGSTGNQSILYETFALRQFSVVFNQQGSWSSIA